MKIDINAEIFLSAREAEGKSQEDIERATGISQARISAVENDLTGLTQDELNRVAAFLGYDPSLFVQPDRVRSGASACLYHRKRKTIPAKALHRLEGRMFLSSLHTHRLLRSFDLDAERMFHTLDLDDYGTPDEAARALRRAWRIGPGPIGNLMALIESAGGIVLMGTFDTRKLFGMSCWSKNGRPFFFLNDAMPTDELRWTLAHETAHLMMHGKAPDGDPEIQADEFAAEFLMPAAEIRPQLRNLDFRRLPQLKAYWRVSMKTLINRASKLDAISKNEAVALYKQYNARRYASGEPFAITDETPSLLSEAFRLHMTDHKFTINDLAKIAGVTPDRLVERLMVGVEMPRQRGNIIRLVRDAPNE